MSKYINKIKNNKTFSTIASYYIFKTDRLTGKTIHICNGVHKDERECRIHWQSYMYGFYDGIAENFRPGRFDFRKGDRELSFIFCIEGKVNIEYFMLLDKAGEDLIKEISK